MNRPFSCLRHHPEVFFSPCRVALLWSPHETTLKSFSFSQWRHLREGFCAFLILTEPFSTPYSVFLSHPTLQLFCDSRILNGCFVFANTRGVCAWLTQGCDRLCCTSTLLVFSIRSSPSDWDANELSPVLGSSGQVSKLLFCFFVFFIVLVENAPPGRSMYAGHNQSHRQTDQMIKIWLEYSPFSAMWLVSVSTSLCVSSPESLEPTNLTKFWLNAHLFILEEGWLLSGSSWRFLNIVFLLKGQDLQ